MSEHYQITIATVWVSEDHSARCHSSDLSPYGRSEINTVVMALGLLDRMAPHAEVTGKTRAEYGIDERPECHRFRRNRPSFCRAFCVRM
jgi:hypothetical protein